MSAPPKTALQATAGEAEAIRAAVREVRGLELMGDARRLAHAHDLAALTLFLSDPAVSDPIYDLPRPFTEANVGAWIGEREARHARGEGALLLVFDGDGSIVSYADVAVWPERASGNLRAQCERIARIPVKAARTCAGCSSGCSRASACA